MTVGTQFEVELKKRVQEEIERLCDDLEAGTAIKDYAQYQHYVGMLKAYRRAISEFCDDVNETISKR